MSGDADRGVLWRGGRPNAALRFGLRLPAYLYRCGLGWILGHRFLLLVHVGRRSGRVYYTVLEVILYDPESRESVVLSARGERADWYRNIEVRPALEVRTDRECYEPEHRVLCDGEAYAVLTEYAVRHPLAARVLAAVFGSPEAIRSAAARRDLARSVKLVAFRPREVSEPGRRRLRAAR